AEVIVFVEERAQVEGRCLVVVSDDQAVFGAPNAKLEWQQARVNAFDQPIEYERSHLVVKRWIDRIDPNAGRGGHPRPGLGIAWGGRERVPGGLVDRRRERRSRATHEPVVFAARRDGERRREGAVAAFAESGCRNVPQDAPLGQAAWPNVCLMLVQLWGLPQWPGLTFDGWRAA